MAHLGHTVPLIETFFQQIPNAYQVLGSKQNNEIFKSHSFILGGGEGLVGQPLWMYDRGPHTHWLTWLGSACQSSHQKRELANQGVGSWCVSKVPCSREVEQCLSKLLATLRNKVPVRKMFPSSIKESSSLLKIDKAVRHWTNIQNRDN